MKGSLSAGHILRMFWEAVMETGEVRVLGVSEQRERDREPVAVQNVFSLLCINLSENKPPS